MPATSLSSRETAWRIADGQRRAESLGRKKCAGLSFHFRLRIVCGPLRNSWSPTGAGRSCLFRQQELPAMNCCATSASEVVPFLEYIGSPFHSWRLKQLRKDSQKKRKHFWR